MSAQTHRRHIHGLAAQIEFKVNLHLLLECLQIFGVAALATTHCQLSYSSTDW